MTNLTTAQRTEQEALNIICGGADRLVQKVADCMAEAENPRFDEATRAHFLKRANGYRDQWIAAVMPPKVHKSPLILKYVDK